MTVLSMFKILEKTGNDRYLHNNKSNKNVSRILIPKTESQKFCIVYNQRG